MMLKVLTKAMGACHCIRGWIATLCLVVLVSPLQAMDSETGTLVTEKSLTDAMSEEQETLRSDGLVKGEMLNNAIPETEVSSPEVEPETLVDSSINMGASLTDSELESVADQEELSVQADKLGPVVIEENDAKEKQTGPVIFSTSKPWQPSMVPFLNEWNRQTLDSEGLSIATKQSRLPSPISEVDINPPQPSIAILIDDLGYNRLGMEASLKLPKEVALAILPETPFAKKTALASEQQQRITLLHAPMENQRAMKLGPGGLYQDMPEEKLKAVLAKNLEGLPGVKGVNNHMGSLLTTKENAMTWVMEILKGRSLFFIDSLTSADSVAGKIAKEHGLKTVTRDVFLDNIRSEKAIDKQFERLLKHARHNGAGLAIGHPYPETMKYLNERLAKIGMDGVKLIPITDLLTDS